ncbi:MAG: ATP-binding cassette domain-containing protein, partial [Myxococcota bacterium]
MAEILLSCTSIAKAHQSRTLFQDLSLGLFDNDRVGLIGPNGVGKSTLLRILAEQESADQGERSLRKNTRLCYVPQVSRFDQPTTIEQELHAALQDTQLSHEQSEIRVQKALSRAQFRDPHQHSHTLSGGWKKRLALACAWVNQPDFMLLDEPTNHLDLDGILWLESLLQQADFGFLMVTHDRFFLERVARSIIELHPMYPGGFLRVQGNYSRFLQQKDEALRTLAQEEETLRTQV